MDTVLLPKLEIISYRVEYTRNLKWKHEYKCFCGNKFVCIGADVNSGRTKSCGCYNKKMVKLNNKKHGLNKTPEHRAWVEMRRRCFNPTRPGWKNYGGRGISVCASWCDSFEQFFVDMGAKPTSQHSLDRIDNNGNYEPNNCRWATRSQQNANQRRWQKADKPALV